jgi:hypothetical protein
MLGYVGVQERTTIHPLAHGTRSAVNCLEGTLSNSYLALSTIASCLTQRNLRLLLQALVSLAHSRSAR